MSCGVGGRHGLDPVLLWLWCRLAAVAQIGPLAWELPYAEGGALKTKQANKQKQLPEAMHIDARARMANNNTSSPFAAAWKLSLGRKLGTHRAHLICFSEINTLSSALGTVVTHILLVIQLFQAGGRGEGGNSVPVIPYWLEVEIHCHHCNFPGTQNGALSLKDDTFIYHLMSLSIS